MLTRRRLLGLVNRIPDAATLMDLLKTSHTLVVDVGRIAAQAGIKKLVLSHLMPVPFTGMSDQRWIDAVRPTWAGELVVAHDLAEIAL